MIQEEKDLLLKDLCARLPYGVRCSFGVDDAVYEITGINPTCCGASEIQATHIKSSINGDFRVNSCKPYIFPLSSMTEEKIKELQDGVIKLELDAINGDIDRVKATEFEVDWYNKNHVDWRGLIPMGLANDATGLNIY